MIKKIIRKLKLLIINKENKNLSIHKPLIRHGEKGIKEVGHRNYVGGLWDEIGKLQFAFLLKNGLQPSDVFLDIACGSLRAGVHIIPYLNSGNYLGIDKEKNLIDLGLKEELNQVLIDTKSPEFVISSKFEFNKFKKTPTFAIAQSLFTHLPPSIINLCFRKLKNNFDKNGVFYATYFLTDQKFTNHKKPHDHGQFKYTTNEIINFGDLNGWETEIIGDWNHPRKQIIVKYTLKSN